MHLQTDVKLVSIYMAIINHIQPDTFSFEFTWTEITCILPSFLKIAL